MRKFKVYNESFNEVEAEDCVGCWYITQNHPQEVYIYIHNSGEVEIDYGVDAVSGDVFHNRCLALKLHDTVYHIDHCAEIIADLELEIKALLEGYEEDWDGNNYRGSWNLDLALDLEKKISGYRSTIGWDREGVIEESFKNNGGWCRDV